jgi:3D (Asp-Asp-Asp) domain-containing protein
MIAGESYTAAKRKRRRKQKHSKLLIPFVVIIVFLYMLSFFALYFDIVSITDSKGFVKKIITTSKDVKEILLQADVSTVINDKIKYTSSGFVADLYIEHSFPVEVIADGNTHSHSFDTGLVSDALEALGVELGEDDYVTPALDSPLTRDMKIEVTRVVVKKTTQRAEVADTIVKEYIKSLKSAKKDSFTSAKSNIYDISYTERFENGKLIETKVNSLNAVAHPSDKPVPNIYTGKPISSIDSFMGITLGEDGLPTKYKKKMSSAICTAYASSTGRGASGLGLYCGTVAVNPKVIPYGTRLFICSSDMEFVYGFAIATDCGTAMFEGRVDIDLFFETNKECNAFGKKKLDVYILD